MGIYPDAVAKASERGSGDNIDDVLLHEFAHHYLATVDARILGRSEHGSTFYLFLADIAAFWYGGDASRYCWSAEYKHGYQLAKLAGLNRQRRSKKADRPKQLGLFE